MSFDLESQPDPDATPAGWALKAGGRTVKELKATLATLLPDAAPLIAAVFRVWPDATPCDARWLVQVNGQWESIRLRTTRGARTANLQLVNHHKITEALATLLGPVVAADLASLYWEERGPRLRALFNFLLRAKERVLLDFLEKGPPEQAGERVRAHVTALRQMEDRLQLGASLTSSLPAQGELDFALELQEEDPAMAFPRALRRTRQKLGLSAAKFARLVGLLTQNLERMERGRNLPGPGSRDLLSRLAAVEGGEELMAAYRISRNFRDRQKPRCLRNDVALWDYILPAHQAEMEDFRKHEASRFDVPRRGRLNSRGALAANSCKRYFLFIRQVLATLQLPADEPDPRRRGLGLAGEDLCLLDLLHLPFLEAHFQRQNLRCGRESFGPHDAGIIGKLIDMAKEGGYFHTHAERLAEMIPTASLARCPTVWPAGSDRPGAPCLTGTERIRALCRTIRRVLPAWRRAARHAPRSKEHLRRIIPLLKRYYHPLDGVMEIFRRHHRRIPRTRDEALTMLCLALLALQCWRPRRPEEFGLLLMEDLVLGENGLTSALSKPKKNGESARARAQAFLDLPPELAQPVRDYLEYARPLLLPDSVSEKDPVFCNREGGKLSPQTVGSMLNALVERLAPDIFPMGLNPHALRTIGATDVVLRFGLAAGLPMAAEMLIDHTSTTLENYIVCKVNPARLQAGEKTQQAAISAAFCAAFGHKLHPSQIKA